MLEETPVLVLVDVLETSVLVGAELRVPLIGERHRVDCRARERSYRQPGYRRN